MSHAAPCKASKQLYIVAVGPEKSELSSLGAVVLKDLRVVVASVKVLAQHLGILPVNHNATLEVFDFAGWKTEKLRCPPKLRLIARRLQQLHRCIFA